MTASPQPEIPGTAPDVGPLTDFSRLCVHTITTKPWSIEEATRALCRRGRSGRDRLAAVARRPGHRRGRAGASATPASRSSRSAAAGSFPAGDAAGTPGGHRRQPPGHRRGRGPRRAADRAGLRRRARPAAGGLAQPDRRRDCRRAGPAPQAGVRLAIEPLHPMYADARSAINTLRQANDLCDRLDSPHVGVAVDVYHVWWDPDLKARDRPRRPRRPDLSPSTSATGGRPTEDLLNDRGLMGEGCIHIRADPRLGRADRLSRLHRSRDLLQPLLGHGPGRVLGEDQGGVLETRMRESSEERSGQVGMAFARLPPDS